MERVVTLASIHVPSAAADVPRPGGACAAASLSGSWEHALDSRAHAFSWFHGPLSPGHASCDVVTAGSWNASGLATLPASLAASPGPGAPASRVGIPFNAADHPDSCEGAGDVAGAGNAAEQASSRAGESALIAASKIVAVIVGAGRGDAASTFQPRVEGGHAIPPSRVTPATFHAAARDAVRVHLEQGADGLTVWIGFDAQPGRAAVDATQLTSSLLRAADLPARIAAVYCNGARTFSNGRIPSAGAATRINHIEEQA